MRTILLCLLLLLPPIAKGSTDIYSCDIKIPNKSFVGWIPYSLQVTFYDDGTSAKVGYGHDFDSISMGKYSYIHKQFTGKISLTTTANRTYETRHFITIYKDKKIIYDLSTVGADHAYVAHGNCRLTPIKSTATYQQTKTTKPSSTSPAKKSCSSDIKYCSDTVLCLLSNEWVNGNKVWSDNRYSSEARKRGIPCGTNPLVRKKPNSSNTGTTCNTNMRKCSSSLVCTRATTNSSGKRTWLSSDSIWYKYVTEAKKRKLSCGVKPSSSSTNVAIQTCATNASLCSATHTCEKASYFNGSRYAWNKAKSSQKYVAEAKKRKLTCGVKSSSSSTNVAIQTCATNASLCSATHTCEKASYFNGSRYAWNKAKSSQKYVAEAKKRGLSCKIKDTNLTVQQKTPPSPTPCGVSMNQCAKLSGFQITTLVKGRTLIGRYLLDSSAPFREVYSADKSYTIFINDVHKPKFGYRWRVTYDDQICYYHSEGKGCASIYKKWDKSHKKWKYLFYSKVVGKVFAEVTSSTDIEKSITPEVIKPSSTVPKAATQHSTPLHNPLHLKKYGKAYYTPVLPNVIFYIGEIENDDERGFRRALRAHKIDSVVLVSKGGLIYTGLELANIIFDNNLTTYIPAGHTCASACSFMFFGGTTKVAHGRLGVHQFYLDDDKKKVTIGTAQRGTQYTVSDIIENLTDFGTPASVFAKMFSTTDMYYFTEEEKASFSNIGELSPETTTSVNEILYYFKKYVDDEFDDSVLSGMRKNMQNNLMQLELIRIGCMKGPADGIKGEATISAIQLLSSKMGSNLSTSGFSQLFRRLNNTDAGACY